MLNIRLRLCSFLVLFHCSSWELILVVRLIMPVNVKDRKNMVKRKVSHFWLLNFRLFICFSFFRQLIWRLNFSSLSFGLLGVHVFRRRFLQFFHLFRGINHHLLLFPEFLLTQLILLFNVSVIVSRCKLYRLTIVGLLPFALILLSSILIRHVTELGAFKHIDATATLDELLILHLAIVLLFLSSVVLLDQELFGFMLTHRALPFLFPHGSCPRRAITR